MVALNGRMSKALKRAARERKLNPDLVLLAYKRRRHTTNTPPKNAYRPSRRAKTMGRYPELYGRDFRTMGDLRKAARQIEHRRRNPPTPEPAAQEGV